MEREAAQVLDRGGGRWPRRERRLRYWTGRGGAGHGERGGSGTHRGRGTGHVERGGSGTHRGRGRWPRRERRLRYTQGEGHWPRRARRLRYAQGEGGAGHGEGGSGTHRGTRADILLTRVDTGE